MPPPFFPLRSGAKATSRPSRQKEFSSSHAHQTPATISSHFQSRPHSGIARRDFCGNDRLQPANPTNPSRQVLRLPRARSKNTQGRLTPRCRSRRQGRARVWRTRDHLRSHREQRTGSPNLPRRSRRAHAASGSEETPVDRGQSAP